MKHLGEYLIPVIFETNILKEFNIKDSMEGYDAFNYAENAFIDAKDFLKKSKYVNKIDFISLEFSSWGYFNFHENSYLELSGMFDTKITDEETGKKYIESRPTTFNFNWDKTGRLISVFVNILLPDDDEDIFQIWERK